MRIAITSPTNWPYVRRGAERFINELAGYLASRGHSVTIICGKPGKSELVNGNGYTTRYCRRWWHPVFAKLGLLEFHMFFFPCLLHLLWNRYDAVLCLTFMDAFALGGFLDLSGFRPEAFLVDDYVLVSEAEIAQAMCFAAEHERWVVEGSAGVALGAFIIFTATWRPIRALFGF